MPPRSETRPTTASPASSRGKGDLKARPPGRESENENLRPSGRSGKPPRPATEPEGAEASSRSAGTETDPGSGEPNSRSGA